MKILWAPFILFGLFGLPCYAQSSKSEPKKTPYVSIPNTKPIYTRPTARKSVTVTQVEKQTGGTVIGANPVNVQGRQLNQIKVLMPNGRVIIPKQLFDENGRSVETVIDVERVPEIEPNFADD
jgi:hypothetical protein